MNIQHRYWFDLKTRSSCGRNTVGNMSNIVEEERERGKVNFDPSVDRKRIWYLATFTCGSLYDMAVHDDKIIEILKFVSIHIWQVLKKMSIRKAGEYCAIVCNFLPTHLAAE